MAFVNQVILTYYLTQVKPYIINMRFRHFFIFMLAAVCFSSCTIQQHIQFNKNLSGTVTSTIDMSMLTAMMPKKSPGDSSATPPGMPNMDNLMDSLKKGPGMDKLKDIKGISNFQYKMDKKTNKMTFSYDFKNLDALNRAMAQGATGNPGAMMGNKMPMGNNTQPKKNKNFKYFTKKGRYITYKMPKTEVPKDMGQNMNQQNPMMSGDMIKFEFKISFARKIKKVKTKNNIFKSDNYIEYKTNIQEMMKQEKPVEITIKYR